LTGVAALVAAHLWNRITFCGWSAPTVNVNLPLATGTDLGAGFVGGANKIFSPSYEAEERLVDLYLALYSNHPFPSARERQIAISFIIDKRFQREQTFLRRGQVIS
jgi:hypothetical protein